MKRITFLALVFMVCGFSVYGQTAPKVYISGSYLDGVTEKACYWVDGKRLDLPEGISAIGIAIENGKVYAAGNHLGSYSSDRKFRQACYWIDGEKYDMKNSSSRDYKVTGIAVTDGNVYVTGYYDSASAGSNTVSRYYNNLWIDGELTSLGDRSSVTVRGITIIDGTACFLYPYSYTFYGQSQDLNVSGTGYNASTSGITTADGKIYVSGYSPIRIDSANSYEIYSTACYWVDGKKVDLT